MLVAYNNDPKLKSALVREIKWHQKQDRIVQGQYGSCGEEFRGCAIGCAINSLSRVQKKCLPTDRHMVLQEELGIPVEIAHLIDAIFEELSQADAMGWPLRVAKAVKPGADLSMVIPHFLYWILSGEKDGLLSLSDLQAETRTFISAVNDIYAQWTATGVKPRSDSRVGKAARAAWIAWAARAKTSADKLIELIEAAAHGELISVSEGSESVSEVVHA